MKGHSSCQLQNIEAWLVQFNSKATVKQVSIMRQQKEKD